MSNDKRPARLGRGLSSLMSAPAAVLAVPGSPPAKARLASISEIQEVAVVPAISVDPPQQGTESSQSHTDPSLGQVAAEAPIGPATSHVSASAIATTSVRSATGHVVISIELSQITPNPNQPRKLFDAGTLEQLAASIRSDGLIQPIIVRRTPTGGYELVAGERRFRAAQIARLESIPAIVRELTDRQSTEWALIENLQREDLNPMDRAEAFQQLIDRYQLNHESIAERVGQDRSTISNFLRLLSLHRDVQDLVRNGLLSFGKARALVGLPDFEKQRALAIRAVRENLSARQVEAQVRAAVAGETEGETAGAAGRTPSPRAAHLADLQEQIGRQLGTRVNIAQAKKKGAGTLSIAFYSNEQFEDLLSKLGVRLEG